jgi:hypothetical protein
LCVYAQGQRPQIHLAKVHVYAPEVQQPVPERT